MKKFLLLLFIVFDLFIFSVSCYFVYNRVMEKNAARQADLTPKIGSVSGNAGPGSLKASFQASTASVHVPVVSFSSSVPVAAAIGGTEQAMRNIGFSYKNVKAKKVMIRAEFNGWKAEDMHRDSNGVWTYRAALPPSEYGYCFTVDGKAMRDPANKRTKIIGQTTVSSVVVTPLPAAPAH